MKQEVVNGSMTLCHPAYQIHHSIEPFFVSTSLSGLRGVTEIAVPRPIAWNAGYSNVVAEERSALLFYTPFTALFEMP